MIDIYYTLDKLSASRLNVLHNLKNGRPLTKAKKETMEFGRQLHQACLQPVQYAAALARKESVYYDLFKYKIQSMKAAVYKNEIFKMLYFDPFAIIEEDHFFLEDKYDLECKLRADIAVKPRNTVFDLKSTAETTREGFEARIEEYGYHRQGAFYLDGVGCESFIIVAVSKTFPHNTFSFQMTNDHPLIIKGRKENEELIDYYLDNRHTINFNELMAA